MMAMRLRQTFIGLHSPSCGDGLQVGVEACDDNTKCRLMNVSMIVHCCVGTVISRGLEACDDNNQIQTDVSQ